ncbi:unnamed protein product [Ceutorhynchus assimilis]|uniref:Raptor N-terminal CASPase-like domain-containing protein n=1 Tax=Ceutorhynchus assimilis TaxID=467358 RepID=A0A9N9MJN6_9CUCU|nr:unnamed protein product [Ceutorhynchus assimilis]
MGELAVEACSGGNLINELTDTDLPLRYLDERHIIDKIEGIDWKTQTWRMEKRMKTVSVALVLCLNVGVDPPDIMKTQPCARLEYRIDPLSMSVPEALENIGQAKRMTLVNHEASPLVRKEIVYALQWLRLAFDVSFAAVASKEGLNSPENHGSNTLPRNASSFTKDTNFMHLRSGRMSESTESNEMENHEDNHDNDIIQQVVMSSEMLQTLIQSPTINQNANLNNSERDTQDKDFVKLSQRCEKLENNYIKIERQNRKNNIILFGLDIDKSINLVQFIVTKFKELLDIGLKEIDINNIYVLRAKKGTPIKIEFTTYLKKSEVFRCAYKLKDTNVYIAHDMCFEDRQEYDILRKHFKRGKETNLTCKIKNLKLEINGTLYSAEQLENNQEKIYKKLKIPQRSLSNESLPSNVFEEEATLKEPNLEENSDNLSKKSKKNTQDDDYITSKGVKTRYRIRT